MDEMFSAVQAANERANEYNAEQAQLNRDWQLMMSNTAHQREIADLKKAGLNPVLSANAGASTPSGAQASASDSSGAIAGLLGQVISAQSAQAIANAQIASQQLIETMRESHDWKVHEQFPNGIPAAIGSLVSLFTDPNNSVGKNFTKSFKNNPVFRGVANASSASGFASLVEAMRKWFS